ncbi:MAG: PAS domain S-box protein [Pseudomonadota bacterium]
MTLQAEALPSDTRRTSAEQSAAEHFRILVQGVVDYALYMLDPDGRVTTWNVGAERIKGYSAEEIIGQHFSRFYTPEDQARGEPARALAQARDEGRYETESLRLRKDGTRFWAHVVIDPIRDSAGRLVGFAKITRDITERKLAAEELQQARMQLMQAQKMEAIGQLTGGIAHDFNNMLAGIIGGLNLLDRRIAAGRYEDTRHLIDAALASANRAAALISRLLAFGRRLSLDISAVDVNASIKSMGMLLENTIGENVNVTFKFSERDVWVLTDAAQLESAVLNLVINARDAMPNGGALTIETCEMALNPEQGDGEKHGGAYGVVRVTDSGEGMNEEVLAKVFDPFFTTKPIGQGTGLGLSMVYGFVRQSGGRINIESKPGVGTTVTLALPLTEPAEGRPRACRDAPKASADEGILVVEDDNQVRMLVVEVLRELGYRTYEASDALRALDLLDREARIDLIVSDVGLPGVDGRRFAELARQKRPDVKVLFITGYAQHAAVRSAFLGAHMDMMAKPFALDDLARKVRDMLASD